MFVEVCRRQVHGLRLCNLTLRVRGSRLVEGRLGAVSRSLGVVLKSQSRELFNLFVIFRHEQVISDDVVHRLIMRVEKERALQETHRRGDGIQVLLTTNVVQTQLTER